MAKHKAIKRKKKIIRSINFLRMKLHIINWKYRIIDSVRVLKYDRDEAIKEFRDIIISLKKEIKRMKGKCNECKNGKCNSRGC